jgi:hypothetical protein
MLSFILRRLMSLRCCNNVDRLARCLTRWVFLQASLSAGREPCPWAMPHNRFYIPYQKLDCERRLINSERDSQH